MRRRPDRSAVSVGASASPAVHRLPRLSRDLPDRARHSSTARSTTDAELVIVRWLASVGVNGFHRDRRSSHSDLPFAGADRGGEQPPRRLSIGHVAGAHPDQAEVTEHVVDVPQLAALVERAELARLLSPDSPGLPRNSDGDRDLFLPTSIAATRSSTISTTVPFQSLLHHSGHVTHGSGMKIKILRLALTGSDPEYPPGPDQRQSEGPDSTRTKNWRVGFH